MKFPDFFPQKENFSWRSLVSTRSIKYFGLHCSDFRVSFYGFPVSSYEFEGKLRDLLKSIFEASNRTSVCGRSSWDFQSQWRNVLGLSFDGSKSSSKSSSRRVSQYCDFPNQKVTGLKEMVFGYASRRTQNTAIVHFKVFFPLSRVNGHDILF